MNSPLYALVAYVRSPIGRFVEDLRRDLHPEIPELPAHVTVLPPRQLPGTEEEARLLVQEICRTVKPFEIVLGDVETFAPSTPTVFIRVAHAAYRMRDLHDRLNTGALQYAEPWPYMPHLTVVKLPVEEDAVQAAELARQRWASFGNSRRVLIEELTFVREDGGLHAWLDLASFPLGRRAAVAKK
jgi:2'-5' RNA ligase